MSADPERLPRLLLVVDRPRLGQDWVERVADACSGGVRWVQLRHRDADPALLRGEAAALDRRLPPEVIRSVNDRPDVAEALGWGLHLPAARLRDAASTQRGSLTADAVTPLGSSAHDPTELQRASRFGMGYVVVGTLFATASKPGHPGIGLDRFREIVGSLHASPGACPAGLDPAGPDPPDRESTDGASTDGGPAAAAIPVYAIGGVTADRCRPVRAAGAYGVALCDEILAAADAAAAASRVSSALGENAPG